MKWLGVGTSVCFHQFRQFITLTEFALTIKSSLFVEEIKMSQSEKSDSSTDSTITVPEYIDIMSLAQEQDEDDEGKVTMENTEATVVLQDEVELMIQRVSQSIDCGKEVLGMLLQIDRSMKGSHVM